MLMPYIDGCRIGNFSSSRDVYWKELVVIFKCIYDNDNVPGSCSLVPHVSILITPHCTQDMDIASILLRHKKREAIVRSYGQKYNCHRSHSQ